MSTLPQPQNHQSQKPSELYPGIYQGDTSDQHDLRIVPLNTLLGFEMETYQIPLENLLPSKKFPNGLMSARKYKQVVSSINEIGLIEPLSMLQTDK